MSNLAQYIDDVRLFAGDSFSDATILLALENGVKYLGPRWEYKYLIFGSGILTIPQTAPIGYYSMNTPNGVCDILNTYGEGDVVRNCYVAFESVAPPVIQDSDLPALLIATTFLLRRSLAASSMTGLSWSTPDLSFSNIQASKLLQDLMKQDLEALNLFFKFRLGRMQVGRFNYSAPFLPEMLAVDRAKWFWSLSKEYKYNI